MVEKEKLKILLNWVKRIVWEENDARTDASLKVLISCEANGEYDNPTFQALAGDCSKMDYIAIVETLCTERAERFTIDAIDICLHGDVEDTTIDINAEIHLAE